MFYLFALVIYLILLKLLQLTIILVLLFIWIVKKVIRLISFYFIKTWTVANLFCGFYYLILYFKILLIVKLFDADTGKQMKLVRKKWKIE